MAPVELSEIETKVAKEFLERINHKRRVDHLSPLSWNEAVKFVTARKFELDRSIVLYDSHEEVRIRERLQNINPCSNELRKELISGKLTILDSSDASGAAIAVFTARFHNPLSSNKNVTLQSLVWQLDAALENQRTQRSGLVFIYDMTESKYSNFDYDLSVKILNLLKGSFPARLNKVLIVLAPLWFKAPFKIMRLFVREKLHDRVHTVDAHELLDHILPHSLPQHLGGLRPVSHAAWLRKCLQGNRIPDSAISAFFSGMAEPSFFTGKFPQLPTHLPPTEYLDNRQNQMAENIFNGRTSNHTQSTHHQPSSNQVISSTLSRTAQPSYMSAVDTPPPVPARMSSSVTEPVKPLRRSPPDEEKDLMSGTSWNDTDYYTSVFVDNPELMSLEEQLASAIDAGYDGLISEYMVIRNIAHQDSFNAARLPANNSKNRYSDVLCYDKTRVVLEDDKSQNYINANYVNSFEQKKGYICCQGPLPRTVADFWRMVWQEKVRTVVMTTKLVEKGRTKCGVYWPQEVNSMEEYGSFNVMNMDISEEGDFQKTILCLCNKKTGETRFLKHLLFLKWPDYGIPSSADAFLHFVLSVRQAQADSMKEMPEWKGHPRGPPMVVHCSAGVGRSGTFICADICIYMLDLLGKVNVKQVVKNIRTQRALAVQMPDQYVFCHLAILQYAQKKGMIPDNINIPQILKDDDDDY